MKKRIFLMAAFAVGILSASAQNEVGAISFQPKVGLNIANVTDGDGSDARISFAFGAEAEYGVALKFGVSAGLLYSMQGTKDDGVTAKLDYINVPILANYYVTQGFAIKAGIQPGFLVNSKMSSDGISVDIKDFCNKIDVSIPLGASYQIRNFVIDARYNLGLTKILKEDSDSKNSVFQFTVGYKF